MKAKRQDSYINQLENFKLITLENKLNIDFSKIYFMYDFEISLRNSLKIVFPNSIILGCFFHYIKAIMKKFKELGLLKKQYFKDAYKLLIYFKLFPFITEEDQKELLKYIIEHFTNLEETSFKEKIIFFIFYFINNWFGANFTNFLGIADNILNYRTNNTAERFNLKLNGIVEHYHPKLSFFIEKYKLIVKEFYETYINNLKNINEKEDNNISFITNDIYNFSLKLIEKFKSNFGYKILSQLDEEEDLK